MNNIQLYEVCTKCLTQSNRLLKISCHLMKQLIVQLLKFSFISLCFSLNVDLFFIILPNLYKDLNIVRYKAQPKNEQ